MKSAPDDRQKKKKISAKRTKKDTNNINCNKTISNNIDVMESLINGKQFDEPRKRGMTEPISKDKFINIDIDNEEQHDIIKMLVMNINTLRRELNEFKTYVDETYCSNNVYNRQHIDIDNKLTDIMNKLDIC